jgi:hypothetical protein
LCASTLDATAFFAKLGGYDRRVKMKREEKDGQEQHNAKQAAAALIPWFEARAIHAGFNTRIDSPCQIEVARYEL